MDPMNPFEVQVEKSEDGREDDGDMRAGESPTTGIEMHLDKKTITFGVSIVDEAKRPEKAVVLPSLSFDAPIDAGSNIQTRILSKVKSAKDNIRKLFKTTGRVSPAIPNLGPVTVPPVQLDMQDVRRPRSLIDPISSFRIVTISDSRTPGKTRLKAITSLVAIGGRGVEEHVDTFGYVAEVPLLSSSPQFPIVPELRHIPPPTVVSNELPTIEEEAGDLGIDTEWSHTERKTFTASDSCGPLTTSDSEAKYDAVLAAEFATFSFSSNDLQEWSDEVEKEKQAKMDSYFAYVSESLAVPVPKLSTYFGTVDELTSVPSTVKTDTSDMLTSSADTSLVTSVDAEEDRPQLSPIILRGLRRIRSHEDLRNLQAITDRSDSFSDLSCWSFNLGPSDSPAAIRRTGVLRRSVKYDDLRVHWSPIYSPGTFCA